MSSSTRRAIVCALVSAVIVSLAPAGAASAATEPTYRHTFTVIDRLGNADVSDTSGMMMWNLSTGERFPPTTVDGKWQIEAPAGEYGLMAHISTPAHGKAGPSLTMEGRPRLKLDHDTTDTFDARTASKVTFDVGRPGAAQVSTTVEVTLDAPPSRFWGYPGDSIQSGAESREGITDLYLGSVTGDNMKTIIRTTLARRDTHGGFTDSPYVYQLLYPAPGWPAAVQHIDVSKLAAVKQVYVAPGDGETAETHTRGTMPNPNGYLDFYSVRLDVSLPKRRTEYFSPAPAVWNQSVSLQRAGGSASGWQDSGVLTYQPGQVVKENRWHGAVVSPGLRGTQAVAVGEPWIEYREKGSVFIDPKLFSDGNPDHVGWETDTAESRRLYFGDELLPWEDSPSWARVGDRSGTFRLEAEGTRPAAPAAKVSATWTFTSKPTATYEVLPLRVIRFNPKVDDHNRGKAGATVTVPITVQRQIEGPAIDVKTLTVAVSYNDGVTWTAVKLTGNGDNWKAKLAYPAAGAFVSLRGTAVDTAGNSVTETMLHAYQLA